MISGASEEELELATVIADKLLLQKENKELKKKLEDKDDFISKLQATKDKLNKWDYENTMKQKEFIKYLEDYQDGASRSLDPYDCGINDCLGDVLSKYKEITQTE